MGKALHKWVMASHLPACSPVCQTRQGLAWDTVLYNMAPFYPFRNTLPFSALGPTGASSWTPPWRSPLGYMTPWLPQPWCPFCDGDAFHASHAKPSGPSLELPPTPGGSTLGTDAPFLQPVWEKTLPGRQMITIIRHMRYLDFFPGLS